MPLTGQEQNCWIEMGYVLSQKGAKRLCPRDARAEQPDILGPCQEMRWIQDERGQHRCCANGSSQRQQPAAPRRMVRSNAGMPLVIPLDNDPAQDEQWNDEPRGWIRPYCKPERDAARNCRGARYH